MTALRAERQANALKLSGRGRSLLLCDVLLRAVRCCAVLCRGASWARKASQPKSKDWRSVCSLCRLAAAQLFEKEQERGEWEQTVSEMTSGNLPRYIEVRTAAVLPLAKLKRWYAGT
jgi:hypothetical protein